MVLGELSVPVNRLKGAGPSTLRDLAKLGIYHIAQLIVHFPRDWINLRDEVTVKTSLQKGTLGEIVAVNTIARVSHHSYFGFGAKRTLKIHLKDRENTSVELVCFNRNFLENKFPQGTIVWFYGQVETRYTVVQSAHFELYPPPQDYVWDNSLGTTGSLEPQYPLAGTLTQARMQNMIRQAFHKYVKDIEEEIPFSHRQREDFLPLYQALWNVHFPKDKLILDKARKTLIYRELFHLQTAVFRRSSVRNEGEKALLALPCDLRQAMINRLPFTLTEDQKKVLNQIDADFLSPQPMTRLLQGDVGSGKTLIAFLSALPLIQAGFQCVLMAPTELLALQHAENASKLLSPLRIRVAFLSGNTRLPGRDLLLRELVQGNIDYLVGTHAVFSKDVFYKNLRYVVIDEQHRFGVQQRQALLQKGPEQGQVPDLLLMSATPIPRTLALTAFGDMKISVIRTMPQGRKPIITHTARISNQHKVYEFVRRELQNGHQAYFVYPLIEKSQSNDLKDVQSMAKHLANKVYPGYQVGLIHSRLHEEQKKTVMNDFVCGKIQILVATSVVEVGVDVANATCIVIEHAERFGLSALHQLRGRVGRSCLQSYGFLVFGEQLTEEGKTRIKIMMESSDGFYIAEEDLKLRGPGDMTGVKQSGYLKLKIAHLERDFSILLQTRAEVFTLLQQDPGLLKPENSSLRRLWNKAPPFNDELAAI